MFAELIGQRGKGNSGFDEAKSIDPLGLRILVGA
jgi:hypothetical protein